MFAASPVQALWAFDSTDVWAGGIAMVHWDGTSWTRADLPPPRDDGFAITDFWGFASDDLYALAPGQLLHWDGVSWSETTPLTYSASSLWGSSGSDIWTGGYILSGFQHWDGSQVTRDTGYAYLGDLWGSGPADVYGAAYDNGYLNHWNGSRWGYVEVLEYKPSGLNDEIGGVWGSSASDIWAARRWGLVHWDGAGWGRYEVEKRWLDVWGASSDDVWAVAADGGLWHYDGSGLHEAARRDEFFAHTLHTPADGVVWIAGRDTATGAGIVLQY